MSESINNPTSPVMGKWDAVIPADIGSLVSAHGVPLALDKGNNQMVVIFPVQCCHHHASKGVNQPPALIQPMAALFDTSEHIITVYGLSFQTESGLHPAHSTPLTLGSNFRLTYGQIIALGGDFYGNPEKPVCLENGSANQMRRFQENFQQLASSSEQTIAILAITQQYEFEPIAKAVSEGRNPSGVFAALPTTGPHVVPDEDRAFDNATGGRYLNLAFKNFDHFGTDAITCYIAGHSLAQQTAIAARSITVPDLRQNTLEKAYAINAFADHFLTDLFAAGHMRTPRRTLFASADTHVTAVGAGLLAKRMHDEDNKFGLWVENALGDRWVAYGDARYRDRSNAANRAMMKKALQQSMSDIWNAFQTAQVRDKDSDVLRYLPKLIQEITDMQTAAHHRDDPQNWAPLFWWNPQSRNVWRRNQILNPADRTFSSQGFLPPGWGITTTLTQILAAPTPRMPKSEYEQAHLPVYPDETGPQGEVGWPPEPRAFLGEARVRRATGPSLGSVSWQIDGTPGPLDTPPVSAPTNLHIV